MLGCAVRDRRRREPATTKSRTASTATSGTSVRGLVDTDLTPVELNVVHGTDGLLGIIFVGVSNKPEASAAAGVTVFHNHCFFHHSKLFKLLPQGGFFGVPCKAANKQLGHSVGFVWYALLCARIQNSLQAGWYTRTKLAVTVRGGCSGDGASKKTSRGERRELPWLRRSGGPKGTSSACLWFLTGRMGSGAFQRWASSSYPGTSDGDVESQVADDFSRRSSPFP